jgi:hypothetical protein
MGVVKQVCARVSLCETPFEKAHSLAVTALIIGSVRGHVYPLAC